MTDFYHDQARNLLIYKQHSPFITSQLQQAIPELQQINGTYLAVPRTLRNAQVLRLFEYPVPSVMDDYDWPRHPSIPHPYESQKLAANFMVLHPRCFNLSSMGTGKTLSTLWAADFLMRKYKPGTCRALVVCPLSIIQRVWCDALFRNFLNRRTFEVLHGTPKQRLEALARPADFYLINYDGVGVGAHTRKRFELDGFSQALAERSDIQIAICDEASAYKDATTKRHRIARLVIGPRRYVWLLTGTPTPNYPTDAYGLAKMVNNAEGKSFKTFKMETMYQVTNFKWLPQKDGYIKARKLLSPAIRIAIEEVWDAPPCTTQQREIPLTEQQKKLLADLRRDLQVSLKSGQLINAANEAAARQKYLQIAQGVIYDSSHNEHVIDCEPRLTEVEDIFESTDRKIVCFTSLTSVLNMVHRRLSKRWQCLVLNGPVSPKERAENIKRFAEDPNVKGIIADPGTTAHGINEFALVADTVLWFGPTEKNELYLQGVKRVDRPGRKWPMTIIQLTATPLEREIYRRLESNTTMQGALLDLVRRGEL
jgi:SNF2 family DNA or RNA helicase